MVANMIVFVAFLVVLVLLAWPLGIYMAKIFTAEKTLFDRFFRALENFIFKVTGVQAGQEMSWKKYALAVVLFNIAGCLAVFLLQIFQGVLPFNPEKIDSIKQLDLAFNTAVSFMTNTNWQSYSGEATMSYLTQMAGLTVQNFLSAATGIAVAVALIRGLTRKNAATIGNFWVDLVKAIVRVLIPLAIVLSLLFVQQGAIQNFSPYLTINTVEGTTQKIAMGPVASQEAIKLLGTNGGGFFNANSAHPFENPTPLTNFFAELAIFLLPASLLFTFGYMSRDRRQSTALLAAVTILFIVMLAGTYVSEMHGNPILTELGVGAPTAMEGKEVRFGIGDSALFATVTTAASCGAVNAMHDSLTPLGGFFPLLQIMLGEVIFGGVGAGFYGLMTFVILTVFLVGLMVGRTPEYLGKKIEARETKMATLAVLIPAITILSGSAIAVMSEWGTAAIANPGPHGLTEIIYAFASASGNNGSAFAGLAANNPFYNILLALAMLLGRFGVIIPVLAIAGSMAEKRIAPAGAGTFSTTGGLFVLLLISVVMIVGALTFLPALTLGPIVEQLLMLQGFTY